MEVLNNIQQQQRAFFHIIFGSSKGTICLARINRINKDFTEQFFEYEYNDLPEMLQFCLDHTVVEDIYVAPFIFNERKRKKETVIGTRCAWADLDECDPEKLLVKPTILIRTSPGRYQAYWVFEDYVDPNIAEDLSRRIAYFHAPDGADKSGWDLTQLLRIPFSLNHKYGDPTPPGVDLVYIAENTTVEELSAAYPVVRGYEYTTVPMPDQDELLTSEEIFYKHTQRMTSTITLLFQDTPSSDWSRALHQLEHLLYEAGLSREEAFVICRDAACNKYRRDDRPESYLWREICRLFERRDAEFSLLRDVKGGDRQVITDGERDDANKIQTVVEEYIEWGKSVGDAAWQYHQGSAFTLLSSLLAGTVRLPTSYGVLVPNLWFMILADTTLTRKTTAMDLGMDLLTEIDPDAILATDGSIEGIYTGLAMRPGRPSVFLRDEFSGLLDSMVKKDYMAGMAESFTKLYDGKYQKRILRKETIEVKDPVLIMFTGGIKSRILSMLTYEHVASGFLPRFIFITAESDLSKLRPIGPPTDRSTGERDRIRARFATIRGHYTRDLNLNINGTTVTSKASHDAELTSEAWGRYNKIEADLLALGLQSPNKDMLTPTYDRLAKSGLKCAVLLAAARRLEDKIVVTEEDLIKAFSYIDYWRQYTNEVLANIGKTANEVLVTRLVNFILKKPGVTRSEVMQFFRLNSRDAGLLFETMEQRNMIMIQKEGRSSRLYPVRTTVE